MSTLGVARKGIDAAVAPAVLVALFGLAFALVAWETTREAILGFLARMRVKIRPGRIQKDKNGAWER